MKRNILHITPWFNHTQESNEAIFIKRQVECLNPWFNNRILHIVHTQGVSRALGVKREFPDFGPDLPVERVTLGVITGRWFEVEKRIFYFIRRYIRKNGNDLALVNFIVAYPNAIGIHRLKAEFPNIKFVISEHWSAYRFNFNISENHKGLKRIRNIFANNLPLFVVSKTLGDDIVRFSGRDVNYHLVPNILDTQAYSFVEPPIQSDFVLSSINYWSELKNPMVLILALEQLLLKGRKVKLVLAGEGSKLDSAKSYASGKGLNEFVQFPGRLKTLEVKELLTSSHVYLQSSHYETFSIICTEALACGRPVIAHAVGGMKEYINDQNGVLVRSLEVADWVSAIEDTLDHYERFDLKKIAYNIAEKFSAERIGEQYANHLNQILK